jgi:membrane protease YdiL (CAAX protease family)
MTVTTTVWAGPEPQSAAWINVAAVVTGVAILAARPTIASAAGWSALVVVGVFGLVLALGLAAPSVYKNQARTGGSARLAAVFCSGAAVFLTGRLLSAGHAPGPATGQLIALTTLAAVAEEALFRRVAYAALLAAGPIAAVGGSALLFGLAHVTVYGWWAFPLDTAAGIVLGWQRWASGRWGVPAATHALADFLVVI